MKTLHINLSVRNLRESISFYNNLFGAEPAVAKSDYAKWQLLDPRVNFAIRAEKGEVGLNHLGIEVESPEELKEVYANIEKSDAAMMEEGHTVCCYAQSEKSWVRDPQNILWEAFRTYGTSEVDKIETEASGQCCGPTCCADEA